MINILSREFVYIWYYLTLQWNQIFEYWVIGMVLGSAISVFFEGFHPLPINETADASFRYLWTYLG